MAMTLDPAMLRQLVLTFQAELDEQSQAITDGLLALEKGVAGPAREQCLDAMFRAAHNIKGAARGVDVKAVAEIAHHLETLFSTLRREKADPGAPLIGLCLRSLDRMREAMAAFESQQALSFDLPALIDELNHGLEAPAGGEQVALPAGPVAAAPPAVAVPTTPAAVPEPKQPRRDAPLPAPEGSAARAGGDVARIALRKLDQVSSLTEELLASKIEMEDHLAALRGLDDEAQACARAWTQLAAEWKLAEYPAAAGTTSSPLTAARAAIQHLSASSGQLYKQMRASSRRLGLISRALQGEVRMMRLVPVASLLQPLARSVRDIAVELGKKVDYTVSGDGIEMDRPVLEGIKDPLVHLLRNAVDHGIEDPQQRRASGKPETGRLAVSVSALGSRIVMTIEDDGAGISIARIAAAAVRKKLMTAAEVQALTPAETLDLIFHPGFSSKEIITDISGRGVGLDVVLSNLRKLKGSVQVETTEGAGTRFILSLPLTLSTDHGLMVRVAGTLFAIPTASVERVMEIEAAELIDIEASQAVVIDGRAIAARELAAVLELASSAPASREKLPVVVIAKGRQSVALLVDEIVGEREIVIKRLQAPLLAVRNVAGGTLTGSGQVVMVLNPADLVGSALRLGSARVRGQRTGEAPAQAPRVLVVDDSITTRSLEKNILESQGYQVTLAVDGQLGWEALQREDFDLVVTDVEMPVMNGFELAQRIKTSEKYRDIPVVIVTSLASDADRRRGIAVGADAYIVKGQFETKALLDVIHQLI